MERPNLDRIVETHVPVAGGDLAQLQRQLRQEILPEIRRLQEQPHLRWFSFLLHPLGQLHGHDPSDTTPVIHLRLEPETLLEPNAFIPLLPVHFREPGLVPVREMSGVDPGMLRERDWARAWKILGEASEWILCLLEEHECEVPLQHIVQFIHFITNPLGLG